MRNPGDNQIPSRDKLAGLVADAYHGFAPDLLGPLLRMLSQSREACGGDIDKFLIMMVVGIRAAESEGQATDASVDPAREAAASMRGANTRSVAESIGAPRETVRRKVAELIDAGWLVRDKNELRITSKASKELAGVRTAIETLAVRNFEAVSRLLQ